jgi:hypothetical protein
MPEGSEQFELVPGDVLYVPGGWWHRTQCDEDSLSLSFIPRVPSWAQVVIDHLVERLRAQADGAAREHLDRLLEPLRAELAELDARTLLERAALRARVPGLSDEELWTPRHRGGAATTAVTDAGLEVATAAAELTVDGALAELCRWAIGSAQPFSIGSACERAREVLAPREVVALLRTLVDAGALLDEFGER